MLWGLSPGEILLPTPMRAPAVISLERSSPSLSAASRDSRGPILDPRDGDAEDDVVEPEAEVASGDRRQPPRRDQPDEALAGVDRVDRAAGGDPGPRAARRDGMGRRRLLPGSLELYGVGAALVLLAVVARGLVRLATAVSRGGIEFLGAQRAWRSAGIRPVPRGDPASRGASLHADAAEPSSRACGR